MASTRNSSAQSLLAFLLIAGTAVAQAPSVPTEHYGPPSCTAEPKTLAPYVDSVARAHSEQQEGATDAHSLPSAEPLENFGIQRLRLADYADCRGPNGCYWADLDAQYHRAEEALDAQIAHSHKGEKLAVVMDIDETTLSGYCEMKREDFGYISTMFNAWVISPDASVAIPGALRFFKRAQAAGVAVFFITGRPGVPDYGVATQRSDQTAATAANLKAAGFSGWTGLQLRNGSENSMHTIEYKSEERRRIVYQGYRILLSVGDQWSDLLGDPKAEVSVKLPNPFYFLP